MCSCWPDRPERLVAKRAKSLRFGHHLTFGNITVRLDMWSVIALGLYDPLTVVCWCCQVRLDPVDNSAPGTIGTNAHRLVRVVNVGFHPVFVIVFIRISCSRAAYDLPTQAYGAAGGTPSGKVFVPSAALRPEEWLPASEH